MKMMHDKLKNIINEKSFIKKVITFEEIQDVDYKNKYLNFNSIQLRIIYEENDKIKNPKFKKKFPRLHNIYIRNRWKS